MEGPAPTTSEIAKVTFAAGFGTWPKIFFPGSASPFFAFALSTKEVPLSFISGAVSLANIVAIAGFLAGPYFSERLGRRRHLVICIAWSES